MNCLWYGLVSINWMVDKMNKVLAKIKSANLEIKERGILNFWINVDYEDGCSQGIGGLALDSYDNIKERRVGTAYGCEMIRRILLTIGVNDFSEMKGKIIYILGDGEGFLFKPKGIQMLNAECKDSKPLIFEDVLSEFK